MRHRSKFFITIAALGAAPLIAQTAPADQWPRFRGPSSNPVSENPNLPVSWSKTENVEWVTDVPGVGWSSPVVWGNRVFITAATSDKPMKQPRTASTSATNTSPSCKKQGLSAEEINKKLYERDREMPDEIVISLDAASATTSRAEKAVGTRDVQGSARRRTPQQEQLRVRDADDRRRARVCVSDRLRPVRVRLRREAVVDDAAEVSRHHS